ncbi:MAG: carboxypeptidase-like regulatory domain-containing protein [Saprospiraceae bacterium]
MKNFFVLFFGILFPAVLAGQNPLDKEVNFISVDLPLPDFIIQLSAETKVPISFSRDILPPSVIINKTYSKQSLGSILKENLNPYGLDVQAIGERVVVFKSNDMIEEKQKFTIGGYIEDIQTGERLLGANIFDLNSGKGTVSNNYGFFSLTLKEGPTDLVFSYLGYKPYKLSFLLNKSDLKTISLEPSLTLNEIVITSKKNNGPEVVNGIEITNKDVSSLVSLGGEPDLLRTVLVQAGVQSGAEGIGGLNVRGGSNDQNLILLDDVPVYIPQHTWGVYSIFNTSAIQNAKFFKQGFPSRYGGRLSSVLDVRTRDGNKKEFGSEIQLGLLSGKVTLEGPIVKDKASFLFSARRSFTDFYSNLYYSSQRSSVPGNSGTIKYYYYDLNLKINYAISLKDKIYLSLYNGQDQFFDDIFLKKYAEGRVAYFEDTNDENWGNNIASFRWNHTYNNKLFSNTTFTYSKYDYISTRITSVESYNFGKKEEEQFTAGQSNSNIQDITAKIDFEYFPNSNHLIKFGAKFSNYRYQPGVYELSEDLTTIDSVNLEIDTFWRRDPLSPNELSAYVEDEFSPFQNASLSLGIYSAAFFTKGKTWYSLEPRIRFSYKFNDFLSSGISYERMTQFLQLLSTGSIGLPTDIWVSATRNIQPQRARQYSAWMALRLPLNFEAGVSGYYKTMKNLLEFEEAQTLQVNANNWESSVVSGSGWAYGLEFSIKRNTGRTQGYLNYSLGKTERTFDSGDGEITFPFRYDRRHILNLGLSHSITKKLSIKANWTYSTGLATSLPIGVYVTIPNIDLPPIKVLTFSEKNGFRMPAYHYLDIGGQYNWSGDFGDQSLEFGIHNVYMRKNPIFYEIREENNLYQRYVPPLLPTLSYIVRI